VDILRELRSDSLPDDHDEDREARIVLRRLLKRAADEIEKLRKKPLISKEVTIPDITMCNGETCPLAETCFRAPQSGTVPNGRNQSWFMEEPYWRDGRGPTVCDSYWKIDPPKEKEQK